MALQMRKLLIILYYFYTFSNKNKILRQSFYMMLRINRHMTYTAQNLGYFIYLFTWSNESRVKCLNPIGCHDDLDITSRIEPIQLIE